MTGKKRACFMLPPLLALLACVVWSGCSTDEESTPYPGVRYIHRHVTKPRAIDMHIVVIDLTQPGITITTTPANGARPGETDLEPTSRFVLRQNAHIGINGGFFSRSIRDFLLGTTDLSSLAVSKGAVVSTWGAGQKYAINIAADNTVTFLEPAQRTVCDVRTIPDIALYNAIAGNCRLLKSGEIVAKGGNPTYPQTAVAHTGDHRLILFVSDGRRPGFSAGMTYEEVAQVLKDFGAVDAIALDGGGSATMVIVDPVSKRPNVMNRPSDGAERAVGNHLAVTIRNG